MRYGVAHIFEDGRHFSAYLLLPGDEEVSHLSGFVSYEHAQDFLWERSRGFVNVLEYEDQFWNEVRLRLAPKSTSRENRFILLSPKIQKSIPHHLSRLNSASKLLETEQDEYIRQIWKEHGEEEWDWFRRNKIPLVEKNGRYFYPQPLPDPVDDTIEEQDDTYYEEHALGRTAETRRLGYGSRRY